MTREELGAHIDSVCRTLGIYVGAHWNILWDGEFWEIVGHNNGWRFKSLPNKDRTFYDDLSVLVRDFIFLDLATRGLVDENIHRDFGKNFNEWTYLRA